jgi:ESS family glutamate:Na+ symporter
VVSAPLGTLLIRRRKLAAAPTTTVEESTESVHESQHGFLRELAGLGWGTAAFWGSLLLLLACAKASAFVTAWLVAHGAENLPNQVGAMIVGLLVRNVHDLLGLRLLRVETIDRIGSVVLALFLAVATMTLDLSALRSVAVPMFVILLAQVVLTCAFALWVNYPLMGRNYEAAVTSSGLTGFALGATPNAMAAMRSLERAFGPAPRAFLIVPVTGAFLSDVLNVAIIAGFLKVVT